MEIGIWVIELKREGRREREGEREREAPPPPLPPPVAAVTAETPLESAARLLLEKKIRRLPVVNGSNELVGVISR